MINYKIIILINKSMALQPRRAKTDWSGCCQMAVKRTLWLVKRLPLNLHFSFFKWISLLLISSSYPLILTRLHGPHSRPYTSEKFLGYSRELNPVPLGWQSDILTTIANRRSIIVLKDTLIKVQLLYNTKTTNTKW